jgi:hypothetical protein
VGAGSGMFIMFSRDFPLSLTYISLLVSRGSLRDHLPSTPGCRGPRRPLRLGCPGLYHREGQGDPAVTEGTTGLKKGYTDEIGFFGLSAGLRADFGVWSSLNDVPSTANHGQNTAIVTREQSTFEIMGSFCSHVFLNISIMIIQAPSFTSY